MTGQQSPSHKIPSLVTQLDPNLQLGLPFPTAVVSASEISGIYHITPSSSAQRDP